MLRVTEHTRRSEKHLKCWACGGKVEAGQRYRQLVGINEELSDGPRDYVRWAAHVPCVDDHEGWVLRKEETFLPRTLDHIRNYYRLAWVRIGTRVWGVADHCRGKAGTILGGSGPYLAIRWDGEKGWDRYHPHDVEPLDKQVSNQSAP